MVETVNVRLSALPGLQIVAPVEIGSSVEHEGEVQRIARGLGANLFVLGTLQREGETMRITYRIINVSSGVLIAAKSLDGPISDLFGLQDRLATMIAKDLRLSVGGSRLTRHSVLDPSQQARYLEALGLLKRSDKRDSVERAARLLSVLVEERPNAALIHAALGRTNLAMFEFTR
jgi:hypothetical protein